MAVVATAIAVQVMLAVADTVVVVAEATVRVVAKAEVMAAGVAQGAVTIAAAPVTQQQQRCYYRL